MDAETPVVTLVVVPRERFSVARESLESIFEHTADTPYELVYVDGGSPPALRDWLAATAEARDFTLVRTHCYLSPNRARNIGLAHVRTKYLVFVDNDVIVSPGWLGALIHCAEETGAGVVTPLTCEGTPLHQTIHCAGGSVDIVEAGSQRKLVERMHSQKHAVAKLRPQMRRAETGLAEFHCMLVRSSVFDKTGPLDEQFLNTKEHLDFCMLLRRGGEQVYFEPESVVTYIFDRPLSLSDYAYFMLRWSDDWEVRSLRRMMQKWDLPEDGYFSNRIKNRGWRRNLAIWRPVARTLSFGAKNRSLSRILFLLDRAMNWCVTRAYRRTERKLSIDAPHVRRSGGRQQMHA